MTALTEVLLDEHLLSVLVHDALSGADEKGGHDGEVEGVFLVDEEDEVENCTRAEVERDCRRRERRERTGEETGALEDEDGGKGVSEGTGRSNRRGRVKYLPSD